VKCVSKVSKYGAAASQGTRERERERERKERLRGWVVNMNAEIRGGAVLIRNIR
jgi:hypothetical protein